MGNDAAMFASAYGRPKNLQCWLERVKDWDLNRQNTVNAIDSQVESAIFCFEECLNRTGRFEVRTDVCHVLHTLDQQH